VTQLLGLDSRPALILRRWVFVLATVPVLGTLAPSWSWFAILTLSVVCGAMVVHLFSVRLFDRWIATGRLLIADTLLVGFALLGTAHPRPLVLAAYFVVVLLATLSADRFKTLFGGVALLGILAAAAVSGGVGLVVGDMIHLPLLAAAALHFGYLGERVKRSDRSGDRAAHEGSELWVLLEITDTMTGTLDVSEVMHSIVDQVGDLFDTPSCSILLAEERSPGCFVAASKGHPEADMLELDLQKYPEIRRAMETRRPVVIDDIDTSPVVEPVREKLRALGFRSLLVLPLLVGRELVGALFLKSTRPEAFDASVVRFCKVVAGVSANALKNAVLYRDVKETGDTLRRVLDASPDMIVATDVDGHVTEFNPGAERLTGLAFMETVGRPLHELLGAREVESPPENSAPLELTLRRKDGGEMQVSLVNARLTDHDGHWAGRVWIGRDVTKLRRVEKSLAQAERLSSLGEVVAGVAHELNNPLSGVVGYAELLRSQAEDPAQIRDLQRIVDSALRCQKVVFKLLSFARKHAAEKKYQSLNDCVEKVLDLKSYHLRSSQIETELALAPDLPKTCFDFHQMDQVILNMLNNAEQAIRAVRRSGKIMLRTGVEDDNVYLEIEDDGPGVPQDVRDRIFDPFFTTKDYGEGTGLGLSVSYGIVQEHGGSIDLLPKRDGGGSRFRILLPVVEGPEELPEAPAPSEPEAQANLLEGRQILVAEDEPLVLELLARLLTDAGATVTMAQDGEEAWNRLCEDEFDLVVTDLCMPNVCGQELYERVAAERPELMRRFVFATGDLVRQETMAFLHRLPNRILPKPLEMETVRRVLSQAIESAAPEHGTPRV
jgi:PAS domain S-box-containing protein